jgi:hypothetical protein
MITNFPSPCTWCTSTEDESPSDSADPPNRVSITVCLPVNVRDHCPVPIQRHVTSSAIASKRGATRPWVMAAMMRIVCAL